MGTFDLFARSRKMHFAEVIGLLFALVCSINAACFHPELAPNYSNEKYAGVWYEIGKIQTPGGAIFQRNCVCDTATVTASKETDPDAKVVYACRNKDVHGSVTSMPANLKAGEKAGNFEQSFNRFAPPVDYNVIWLDQDTAIEYDCGSTLFIENYCIHFMSKTPTIAPEKLQSMKDYADKLGLNTKGLDYTPVKQAGCW